MQGNKKGPSAKQLMTPLWVISLFVSLTEIVTGIAVTNASGGVQVALTTFVIVFPLLVASAFFIILWNRPYVLYPPTEFASGVDVNQYVNAMKYRMDDVRGEIEAETANIRASLQLESNSFQERMARMETLLADLSHQTVDTQQAFLDYKKSQEEKIVEEKMKRSDFKQKSQYRIEILPVTKHLASSDQKSQIMSLAEKLQNIGYKTSTDRGWGSSFYLSGYKESGDWNKIRIIYRKESYDLAVELQTLLKEINGVEPNIITTDEALQFSKEKRLEDLMPEEIDVIIAYCLT